MRTRRMRRELAAEIEAHIAECAEELMEDGMPEREARQKARREFGNPTLYAESGGEVWGWLWLERLGNDLRYAVRSLRASPLFTVTASHTFRKSSGETPHTCSTSSGVYRA